MYSTIFKGNPLNLKGGIHFRKVILEPGVRQGVYFPLEVTKGVTPYIDSKADDFHCSETPWMSSETRGICIYEETQQINQRSQLNDQIVYSWP